MTTSTPRILLALCLVAASASCRRHNAPAPNSVTNAGEPWFEESAADAGIDFKLDSGHRNRYWFPEIVLGGAALFDFDGDGALDLYFPQGHPLDPGAADAQSNKLYHNLGGGRFEDVTDRAGVGDKGYGMGCACGDYDGDGDTDLYVTNVGPNVLYRNNGDGTFSNVSRNAGVDSDAWGVSSAFVDYDGDGDLDLFVVNYIIWAPHRELNCDHLGGRPDYCKPNNYSAPAPDTLYRNNGDGTFTDVSRAAGLDKAFGNGLGVACGDFNGDGHMDLYVANDGMRNQLWINKGDGTFSDEAILSGCAVNLQGATEAGMGVIGLDVENDGDLDLFMTHLRQETNTFYLNQGGMFEDTTVTMGLAQSSLNYTSFGVGAADFDHDGFVDIYIANGRVALESPHPDPRDPYAESNQVLAGRPGARFEELLPAGGTARPLIHTSRAAALGDIDNDGDIDVVVANRDAAPYVLLNVARKNGNWVMFRVLNRRGADAIGAAIKIEAGTGIRWRVLQPSYGYASSSDPRIHCGLGSAERVDSVTVRWPGGGSEVFGPFEAGRLHRLTQGTGR